MMNGMGMMMWGALSFLLGLIVIFLFVLAIAIAVKWVWRQNPTGGESALEVLNKRYAKGEISKDEYEKIKTDIQ
ncbi:MAG TPA: SHOCT domain-containing protein [Candidatus Binatia bacterium]